MISNAYESGPRSHERDENENEQPLDRAWTIRTDGIRVPAPMREDTTRNTQPLDRAWTIQCAAN